MKSHPMSYGPPIPRVNPRVDWEELLGVWRLDPPTHLSDWQKRHFTTVLSTQRIVAFSITDSRFILYCEHDRIYFLHHLWRAVVALPMRCRNRRILWAVCGHEASPRLH